MSNYSQYAATPTPVMSQAPGMRPMSAYGTYPYPMDASQETSYEQPMEEGVAPPVPEKTLAMAPIAKDADDSFGDISGSRDEEDSWRTDPELGPTPERARPRTSSRMYYASNRGSHRHSAVEPESRLDRPYVSSPRDSYVSPREEGRRSKRMSRGRHSRLSMLETDVRPLSRESRPRGTYEMQEAPELDSRAMLPDRARAAPPIPLRYLEEAAQETPSSPDDTNQQPAAPGYLGQAAAERVSVYLSQLPSFAKSTDMNELAPSEDGRTSRAGRESRSGRRRSRAPSMHTTRSRPVSTNGTQFHDVFDDP